MGLVSKSIPNLINGVSQQPAALRLDTQGEVQINGYSDVVEGLKKRPPTKLIKELRTKSGDPLGNLDTAFVHTYKRSDNEEYTVIATKFSEQIIALYVFDQNGVCSYDSQFDNESTAYLGTSPEHLKAVTVADATFIVNKDKTVALSPNRVPSNDLNQALVYLKSVNYGRQYTVKMTSKQNTLNPDADHTTVKQVTETVSGVGDQVNSDGLKVSSVISETRNTNPCLREEISNELGSTVISNFQALVLQNSGISAYDATVSGFTITTANAEAGKYTVQVGGVTIPYRTDTSTNDYDANGWHRINDTTIRFPAYVTQLIPQSDGHRGRASGRVLYTADASTTHGFISPETSNDEPYFIINTPKDSGDVRDFDIQVTDDDGGVNLKAFKGNAKSFTDLPNQCENGFRLGVVGDNQKKEDDFHVVFTGEAGAGYWKETVAYNLQNDFDLDTMPHTLRQNADLSFTFGKGTEEEGNQWQSRKAGDDNTNPAPSFVGQKITDLFFHRNRLGVLSGENVIFSEASGYYNFWRTTVRALLDSDPIDVAVSQNEVSELKAAVPIQDNLLLFSNLNQFTLSASQLLTPAEVTVDQSTKYECDLTATPVGAGTSVFFATSKGNYAGVREFYTKTDTDIKEAPEITTHVPKYIEGKLRSLTASSNLDMLIALTDEDRSECYVYKWYNSSEERLQSSWSKWKFASNILSVSFNNEKLKFIFEDGSLHQMDLGANAGLPLLDKQFVIEYDENATLIEHPTYYDNHEGWLALKESGESLGPIDLESSEQLGNVYTHLTPKQSAEYFGAGGKIIVGLPYMFEYQLSEQVFKPTNGDSTDLARFQLRKMSLNYSNTGKFNVTVESVGRDAVVSEFTGRILGQQENLLGYNAVVPEGSFQVGVQSQPKTTKITITNDSHLPCVFQSAEWEGFVTLRNQRL